MLLISPGIIKHTDRDFGLPHLVSLGGYLQRELEVRVELLDLGYEGGDHRQLARTLEALGPYLLIGVSCYSSFDLMRVLVLARFLRSRYPEVPLVTGGYHASALPEELLGPFDAVIQGEGELALREVVATLLGGGRLERRVHPAEAVDDLDTLPPYRWELLGRYWRHARQIGQKLQLHLSRGCPHRCSFCMERAKGTRRWRAFSPGRALEELERLDRVAGLSGWVVNLADPLFGLEPSWRREVLQGIIDRKLRPWQFWTLTRVDDLAEEDVELMARARVAIGVGLESGSPHMLSLMQKTPRPERFLAALERLARWSRKHGLTWAANIIVGHPGETAETMAETRDLVAELFTSEETTRGWLSVDPFRLYPGSRVHEQLQHHVEEHGATFHHPTWWQSWYDGAFRAEHLDPSATLDYEARVRWMYERYPPLVDRIARRFQGQGRSVDRVFERSMEEQLRLLAPEVRDGLLQRAAWSRAAPQRGPARHRPAPEAVQLPIGLQVRDPWVSRREEAVRRLLERGVLRSDALVEALLTVPCHEIVGEAEAEALLRDSPRPDDALGISARVLALEALAPQEGGRFADLLATSGYTASLLAELVRPSGAVTAVTPDRKATRRLRSRLAHQRNVAIVRGRPTTAAGLRPGTFDGLWLGAALPRLPAELAALLDPHGGRIVTLLGPRFRRQDLVCISREGDEQNERIIARLRGPVAAGPNGWLRS